MNQTDNKLDAAEHHAALDKAHHSSHRLGMITIMLIFGLFGLWSVFANIETTITASGKVITHSYNKIVMHPRGGIVKHIFIKEGAFVKKDQPLLEIDNTQESAELASSIAKHDSNLLAMCRLEAESKLLNTLECSAYEKKIIDKEKLPGLKVYTKSLFDSDMKSLQAQLNFLESQNAVLDAQNSGLKKQIDSNKRLLESYERELKKWKQLLKSDAVDEQKMIETQRTIEESHLKIGTLRSAITENLANIEANKQKITLEKETFKNKVLSKFNEIKLENRLIAEKIIALKNTISNTRIKAPGDGLVTDMKIHAAGEVVSPQKQIMSIVPDDKNLTIEAYVLPTDIEKIHIGQMAEISFPSFIDPSAKPIEGKLTYLSADAITSPNSKESYYIARVEITPKGLEAIKHNGFKIVPGMPSAAFIHTGKKTLMEYLLQPIIQMFKGIYHAN